MSGYVYIMTSEQRPGICKVGRTSNTPSHRCGQLNASEYLSVTDWKVAHSRKVTDSISAEKRAHIRLMQHKLPLKKHREAFEVDLQEAIREVDSVCGARSGNTVETGADIWGDILVLLISLSIIPIVVLTYIWPFYMGIFLSGMFVVFMIYNDAAIKRQIDRIPERDTTQKAIDALRPQ